ncbi:SusC/RagA family TonB-linked outer membrane protein [Mucilaginibacter sp. Bleaf8]|uniref:SusC/RagA family TonB-linked outer membrane protein n=1 Tax=Mucilaginibacter sp. Bleaf8 TaxID=2834430 RepID=UPI001BD15341|nr:SusC/RagA family TonB-linked outer membrane protein [Mucilaginibacter sp. Bleaf8]MBS7564804.1 SusC/RagA family TonB-linked outer membrane protein [Mucilaginibacter sp. Bleaf8]
MIKPIQLLLLMLAISSAAYSQKLKAITGKVSGPQGLPIVGASVFVDKALIGEQTDMPGIIRNSVIGTITDTEGKFKLSVPEGTTAVRVSYLGYNTILVDIRNKSSLDIKMSNSDNALNDIVVNGYTSVSKRKSTVATSLVEYDKIRQTGVSGVDQMLQGQVAGVNVTNISGGPGSAPKIRIRGTASLNGGQDPLWVLDGIPLEGTNLPNIYDKDNIDALRNLPIAGLNPDDIADITILKDAAATAIYGARASNGVIVITTKKGKKGPIAINFNASTFVAQRPDLGKLNLMNASEKVDFELALASRADLNYRDKQGAIARILGANNELANYRANGFSALNSATQNQINALRQNNTDWGRELYQAPVNQQYGLSLSGGSDAANYYLSTGYYNEKGATKGTGLERYNVTLKTDFNISSKFTAGAALFGSRTIRKSYLTEVDARTNPSNYSRNVNPYQTVYDANGNYAYDQDIFGTSNFSGDVYLPFNAVEERQNTRYGLNNSSLKGIFDVRYKLNNNLKLSSQLGLQFEETGSERYMGANSYAGRKLKESTRYYNSATKKYEYFLPVGAAIQNDQTSLFQYNWKMLAEYSKTIAKKHEIEAVAGTELRKNKNTDLTTRGFGFNERTLTNTNIVFPNADFASNQNFRAYRKGYVENAFASAYGTLSYTYDRRYTVYGSIRYDGSDLFGVDPKYRYLPIYSISGAWNAIEESFIKDINAISNLRIRASYGLQGNVDKNTSPKIIGRYDDLTILPGGTETGVIVTSPPNNKLRWEKTSTFNAGLELGLFRNALQVTVDYYNRYGKDLIGSEALQLENGFEFTNSNFARIRNRGVEVNISTRNVNTKKFSWSTDFNISHNKSKVLREKAFASQRVPTREGLPVNALFVLKTSGLDANGLPLFQKDGQVLSLEDFYQLYDPYADFFPGEAAESKLTADGYKGLYTYIGDRDPKFTGGLTNRIRLGNFDFAATAIFNLNQWVTAQPAYNPATLDRGQNYSKDLLSVISPNSGSQLPAIFGKDTYENRWMAYYWLNNGDPVSTFRSLDIYAKKMSYVRINTMRLGYTLPTGIAKRIKANSIRFSVEARNPFVFGSNYKGYFDPETYGNIYAQPITKSISFGLNASF